MILLQKYSTDPKFILKSNFDIKKLIKLRDKNYKVFPVIDKRELY